MVTCAARQTPRGARPNREAVCYLRFEIWDFKVGLLARGFRVGRLIQTVMFGLEEWSPSRFDRDTEFGLQTCSRIARQRSCDLALAEITSDGNSAKAGAGIRRLFTALIRRPLRHGQSQRSIHRSLCAEWVERVAPSSGGGWASHLVTGNHADSDRSHSRKKSPAGQHRSPLTKFTHPTARVGSVSAKTQRRPSVRPRNWEAWRRSLIFPGDNTSWNTS